MAGSDLPSPHADLPSLEQPRGDGDGGVGPSMMAAERGERGRGCSGGVGPSISTRGPSFLGAAARGWRWRGRTFHDGGRERRAGAGMLWRGRTFHLHTRTFLPWSIRAGMAMAGRRGRGCSGGVGPSISTRGPSFLGAAARGWRWRGVGGAESGRLQEEPCTKMCVRLHYRLIE
jgi:hypothetical protein